jgi:hypothetical protein
MVSFLAAYDMQGAAYTIGAGNPSTFPGSPAFVAAIALLDMGRFRPYSSDIVGNPIDLTLQSLVIVQHLTN